MQRSEARGDVDELVPWFSCTVDMKGFKVENVLNIM